MSTHLTDLQYSSVQQCIDTMLNLNPIHNTCVHHHRQSIYYHYAVAPISLTSFNQERHLYNYS